MTATKSPDSLWQPIETAPKDGTDILLLSSCGYSSHEGRWMSVVLADGPAGWYWAGYGGKVGPIRPKGWMPLPAPPTQD